MKLSSGRYARLADGACVVSVGGTSVLATVVSKAKASSSSFLPLVVDYRQKAAAAGRIPTNFLRRELGATEREVLTSRLIDRSLRPLFPSDYNCDTQVVCNTLSVDSVNPPETLAVNAASAALAVSDVPWNGPIGAVRIGQIDNEVIINPTRKELQESMLNLVVTATKSNLVVMLEGNAEVIMQQDLLKAIKIDNRDLVDLSPQKLKLQRVCDRHFLPEHFYSSDKRRLLPNAVPTAASVLLQPVSTEGEQQIDFTVSAAAVASRKRLFSPEPSMPPSTSESTQDLLRIKRMKREQTDTGTKEAQHIVRGIEKLQKECGKMKREYETAVPLEAGVVDAVRTLSQMRIREILSDHSHDKMSRDYALTAVRQLVLSELRDAGADAQRLTDCFNALLRATFRELVFETDVRCDGRRLDDLRDISCQVDLYEPLHGSALFQRGQTQVLCTVAFDSPESALKMDALTMLTSGIKEKNFFLHYEFPPYATGEVGRAGGAAGRREAGHGALAEKGLLPVVPDQPFTVRLTSEVLESNGSSSMASVCGGSLALLDAGVPLAAPAAGVAVGLITRYQPDGAQIEDYRILTDLLGIEDYMGDMDFKIAGTKKGITALQADIKIPGLPLKIIMESVQKACEAKAKIIDKMNSCIDKPRQGRKENMPATERLEVEAHKRGKLLGVGGANLKRLYVESGVQVTPVDETTYEIFAPSRAALDEARERIAGWLAAERAPELEFGGVYRARVVELRDAGVLVTLYPDMAPALLHNSQLDHRKIMHPSALGLEVGSELQVKYFGRDPVSGQIRLSRKVLLSPTPALVRNLDKS